jgi:hypothetical protein
LARKGSESEPVGGLSDEDAAAVRPKKEQVNTRNRKDNVFHHHTVAVFPYWIQKIDHIYIDHYD